jgi:hypothetical protein
MAARTAIKISFIFINNSFRFLKVTALCAWRNNLGQITGTKFRGTKAEIRSAPVQGTLRAGKWKNQISRVQSRA